MPRMHRLGLGATALLLLILLTSCASPRLRPDSGLLELQQQRERLLLPMSSWTLSGRLAISGPNGSGSGALVWQQNGRDFQFAVSAPVTGRHGRSAATISMCCWSVCTHSHRGTRCD